MNLGRGIVGIVVLKFDIDFPHVPGPAGVLGGVLINYDLRVIKGAVPDGDAFCAERGHDDVAPDGETVEQHDTDEQRRHDWDRAGGCQPGVSVSVGDQAEWCVAPLAERTLILISSILVTASLIPVIDAVASLPLGTVTVVSIPLATSVPCGGVQPPRHRLVESLIKLTRTCSLWALLFVHQSNTRIIGLSGYGKIGESSQFLFIAQNNKEK